MFLKGKKKIRGEMSRSCLFLRNSLKNSPNYCKEKLVARFCTIKKGNTIGDNVDHWHQRFQNEKISEPIESIEHIVAHVIGTKKVQRN